LVNATSVGLGGRGIPLSEDVGLEGKVVLDCVAQPAETPLVLRARSTGAEVVDGVEMWLNQGALQASLWTDRVISSDDLRRFLPAGGKTALGGTDSVSFFTPGTFPGGYDTLRHRGHEETDG